MKNKITILVFLSIIVAYIIYSLFISINKYQSMYYYVINPLFWILLSMFSNLLFYQQTKKHFKYKTVVIEITLMSSLIYILLFFGLGLYSGFGNNPYDNSFTGVLLNIWSIGLVLVSREYMRYYILNSVDKRHTILLGIIITILYSISQINILNIHDYLINSETLLRFITTLIFPTLITNVLFNYLVLKGGLLPSIIYVLLTNVILWPFSILPNHSLIIVFILNTLIPFFTILIIDYYIMSHERAISSELLNETNPKTWIPNFIAVILITSFVLGSFNYKPIAIISNSMNPTIKRGDIVIIQKMDITKIKIDDIVNYQKNNITVAHRVIDKYNVNNQLILITKGDNNNVKDINPVLGNQVIGKVIIIVPKIGYPSIWLKEVLKGLFK